MASNKSNRKYDRAYKEAVKQLEQDRVGEIKALVKKTLEALGRAEKDRQEAVERIQLLKRDIEDLKLGKLDRIRERHEKNTKADQQSPITVKEIEKILTQTQTATFGITTVDGTSSSTLLEWDTAYRSGLSKTFTNAVEGTYVLTDGTVKYV